MGRLAFCFALLLVVPGFSGCIFGESLEVALRVRTGQTLVIDGPRFVDGTLMVEDGGTLVLDGADLRIGQALVVSPRGRVSALDSTVRFDGAYSRQDIESSGTMSFESTVIEGLRDFEVLGGAATLANSTVTAAHVTVNGLLSSFETKWLISIPESRHMLTTPEAVAVGRDGEWSVENGTISLHAVRDGVTLRGGNVLLRNLTLAARIGGGTVLSASAGLFETNDVAFEVTGDGRLLHSSGGTLRLIDSPIPSRQDVLESAPSGRIEVGWTITARAVSPPGNIPVGGINITLNSADAPTVVASEGTTDENGEVRLVALQYVFGGGNMRTGNPHAIRANSGGMTGAMIGVVVEAPASVTVPVFG